ncbi:putative chaperon of flagellar synthesis [Pusillimonas sp. T7-7]|uniref:flagella synthesis protein FlgN n=1 Tax=Pusillimonas sp. (strain T7-7) TaxID=1007105 RepID=UPI0002084855|nr:flagellar protein FlgN [Pusillimonas sp. T7-7]AEC19300.1 putative chaperon of flagellar synthesis [Pusillimonas sp. T7-7]
MNSTITQLHTCLENETSLVCEFIELLEAEAQVLTDGGHEEELAVSTAKKDAYARQLAQAAETRQTLLATLGHGADRTGLDAAANEYPALRAASDRLLEQTRKASELNASNGAIIDTFLEHNQQALDMLRTLAGAQSLYDAKGRTRPGGKGQTKDIKVG